MEIIILHGVYTFLYIRAYFVSGQEESVSFIHFGFLSFIMVFVALENHIFGAKLILFFKNKQI